MECWECYLIGGGWSQGCSHSQRSFQLNLQLIPHPDSRPAHPSPSPCVLTTVGSLVLPSQDNCPQPRASSVTLPLSPKGWPVAKHQLMGGGLQNSSPPLPQEGTVPQFLSGIGLQINSKQEDPFPTHHPPPSPFPSLISFAPTSPPQALLGTRPKTHTLNV